MKKILTIGMFILSSTIFGQIPGKTIEGPIVLFDTLTVRQGDIVFLGKGSDKITGNFKNIYAPQNSNIPLAKDILAGFFSENSGFDSKALPQQNLDSSFTGKQLVIKNFSKISSKKKGKKTLGVINMRDIQLIEGLFFNNIVVDFEPAFKSGEIIKISAPQLEEKSPINLFKITSKGIEPVVVAINNLSKSELYSKAVNWANSYYQIQNEAIITHVPDKNMGINYFTENVTFGTIMGFDLIADLPYLFTVNFTDSEIKMTFDLGAENGDIMDKNGEIIANISPSHLFNKNGEMNKMNQIFKVNAEKIMNDLSYNLVDYLLK
ncbi:DUF4468 domain-containing protein [Lutibacter sp. HS1-25]|uniref:DUF4468 domain-containing protein n=1 Tax=Lutibacter sp. HS1-25 TaxID=2485000 RepID=UPI0010117009|nr:DUF4468 domain-containing protein [Lutibacter sp. HS1-25]RXP57665.1 DUF4468 domain-containing protein [Lutibacter sp. HS1-25]